MAKRRGTPEQKPVYIPAGPFTLGVIPGATPGKWIGIWKERMPRNPLVLEQLSVAQQEETLTAATVDAALVREPIIKRDDLHIIPLYDEVAVVVCGTESHLSAADELTLADLAGEIVITPADDVLRLRVPDAVTPSFDPPNTTEEAIATVAAGVGVVVVPMSLARLHHRRDVEVRPLADGPTSTVALAWLRDNTTPAVEAFVGIVRGRSAHSSRS